ncbi:unnamed protein product, partial [Arabidopsis halleri]
AADYAAADEIYFHLLTGGDPAIERESTPLIYPKLDFVARFVMFLYFDIFLLSI